MAKLSSLSSYLHPLWRDSIKKVTENKQDADSAIINGIDFQLKTAEAKTIRSKMDSFLHQATKEHLDYFGSWFGVYRKPKQSDEDYREAIIYHVEHARNTVDSLREQISRYLKTNIKNVNIYEPWKDVFLTNDRYSRTNGRAHLYGNFYRPAIIQITISAQFNSDIIKIINWFRPAGVIFDLLFDYGDSDEAGIWYFSPYNLHMVYGDLLTCLDVGTKQYDNYSIHLDDKFKNEEGEEFDTNLSDLNSKSIILGEGFNRQYYNYAGMFSGLVTPTDVDTIKSISSKIIPIDTNKYQTMHKKDDSYFTTTIGNDNLLTNVLEGTNDLDKWNFNNSAVLSTESYSGSSVVNFKKSGDSLSQDISVPLGVYNFNILINSTMKQLCSIKVKFIFKDGYEYSQLVTNKLVEGWNTYHADGINIDNVFNNEGNLETELAKIVVGVSNQEDSSTISLTRPMLYTAQYNNLPWQPSLRDYPSNGIYGNNKYLYAVFDLRQYLFDNVITKGEILSYLSSNSTNKDINSFIGRYLNISNLVANYRMSNSYDSQLLIYNFASSRYEVVNNSLLSNNSIDKSLTNLEQYLNDSGILVVAIRVPSKDSQYTLMVDNINLEVTHYENKLLQMIPDNIIKNQDLLNLVDSYVYDYKSSIDFKHNKIENRPIRYIRDYVRNVYPSSSDLVKHAVDLTKEKYREVYASPYYSGKVRSKILDNGNLPISYSGLGVKLRNKQIANSWDNLLTGGVTTDKLFGEPYVKNGSTLKSNVDKNSLEVTSSALREVFFKGQGILPNYSYRLSVTSTQVQRDLHVDVVLHTVIKEDDKADTHKVIKTLDIDSATVNTEQHLDFETYSNYPNYVTLRLYSEDDFSIKNGIRVSVAPKVTVDGKEIDKLPIVVPKYNDFGDKSLVFDDVVVDEITNGETPVLYSTLKNNGATYEDVRDLYNTFGYVRDNPDIYRGANRLTSIPKGTISFNDARDNDLIFGQFQDGNIDFNYINNHYNIYKYLNSGETANINADYTPMTLNKFGDITFKTLNKFGDNTFNYFKNNSTLLPKDDPRLKEGSGIPEPKPIPNPNDPYVTLNNKEHLLEIDLGVLHTDIEELLVHHGSNSIDTVVYEHCLQTSPDGKNWTTLYNNYKDVKGSSLDRAYIEPDSELVHFKNNAYNLYSEDGEEIYDPTTYQELKDDNVTYGNWKDYGVKWRDLLYKNTAGNHRNLDYIAEYLPIPKDSVGYPYGTMLYGGDGIKRYVADDNSKHDFVIGYLSPYLVGNLVTVSFDLTSNLAIYRGAELIDESVDLAIGDFTTIPLNVLKGRETQEYTVDLTKFNVDPQKVIPVTLKVKGKGIRLLAGGVHANIGAETSYYVDNEIPSMEIND